MSKQSPPNDGTPVVAGFIEECAHGVAGPPVMLLKVWCRWCCRWHEHGLADANPGDYVHRVAHCYAPDSEYDQAGYWILVTNTPYSTPRKTMRQASTSQRYAIQDGRISDAVQRLRDQPLPIG
ncbi:hypothetical protein ABTX99_28535 [Streptomyces flaveolus]|uniref:hypothetical protein n=1 Tax=Streptomyces flaveolus TaxID=67297 RepID=UPI00333141F4